jgi:hypothetical protein
VSLEIRQLIIKSKTVNNDSKNEQFDSDNPSIDSDKKLLDKDISYHLISSPNETRER